MAIWLAVAACGVIVSGALFLPLPAKGGGGYSVECSYDPVQHRLTAAANSSQFLNLGLIRSGDEVVVLAGNTGENPAYVPCEGDAPTVENVDRIDFVSNVPVDVDLAGGAFAPGFTAEDDDSSEIEIYLGVSSASISGSPATESIALGEEEGEMAANLNRSEATRDLDLFLTDGVYLVVDGRGGQDTLSADGGEEFDGPLGNAVPDVHIRYVTSIYGGNGADTLTSTPWNSISNREVANLNGQAGDDVIRGRRSADAVVGGIGRDRLVGKGGDDDIDSRDIAGPRQRDEVKCGIGADIARVDDLDKVASSCDRVPVED